MDTINFGHHCRFAGIADETKLVLSFCFSILVLLTNHIPVQAAMLVLLLTLALAGGINLRQLLKFAGMFLPVIGFIFLFHLFYHEGQTLFTILIFTATYTGLESGCLNLLRFVNFLLIAGSFFYLTSPLNMATRLATFFGLAKGRFFQEIALVFFIALRFLPVLARERRTLTFAMRARGMDFGGGLISRISRNVLMLFPLLSRVIGQTDDVAAALALKGEGATYFVPERVSLKAADIIIIIAGIGLTLAAVCYV